MNKTFKDLNMFIGTTLVAFLFTMVHGQRAGASDKPEAHEDVSETTPEKKETFTESIGKAAGSAWKKASEIGSSVGDAAGDTWDKASEKTKSVGKSAAEKWDKASEKAKEVSNQITGEKNSAEWRAQSKFALLLDYATVDLYLPGKKGITGVLIDSQRSSWELEYLKADISVPVVISDLGSIKEQRLSLMKRTFWDTNSFSGYFGLAWNKMEISLGDEILSKLTGGKVPDIRVLRLESLGFNTGIGNRWTVWKGITYGVDWIGVSQPLLRVRSDASALDNATNKSEKERVERILKTATYFPRFYMLKFGVGMMF